MSAKSLAPPKKNSPEPPFFPPARANQKIHSGDQRFPVSFSLV
jgi:hypothetical protein